MKRLPEQTFIPWADRDTPVRPWTRDVLRRLMPIAVSEPQLRVPVLCAALACDLAIDFYPSDLRTIFPAFITDALQPLSQQIISLLVSSPAEFDASTLAAVAERLRESDTLLAHAMEEPNFVAFPCAFDLCLHGIRRPSTAMATLSVECLIRHWPERLADCLDDLVRLAATKSRVLRCKVAESLRHVDRPVAVEELRKLYSDPERVVRRAALEGLAKHLGRRAEHELALALKDPAAVVRVEACKQTARVGFAELLPQLLERASDSSRRVCQEAFEAIAQIDRALALQSVRQFKSLESEELLDHIGATRQERQQTGADTAAEESSHALAALDLSLMLLEERAEGGLSELTSPSLPEVLAGKAIAVALWEGHSLSALPRYSVTQACDALESVTQIVSPTVMNLLLTGAQHVDLASCTQRLIDLRGVGPDVDAFLIGWIDATRHAGRLAVSNVRSLRVGAHSDNAFWNIALRYADTAFGAMPFASSGMRAATCDVDSSLRNEDGGANASRGESLTGMERGKHLMTEVQSALTTWALIMATPRHLGFLLAHKGIGVQEELFDFSHLIPGARRMVEFVRRFSSTEEVLNALFAKWAAGAIEQPDEAELLAGMGNAAFDPEQMRLFGDSDARTAHQHRLSSDRVIRRA